MAKVSRPVSFFGDDASASHGYQMTMRDNFSNSVDCVNCVGARLSGANSLSGVVDWKSDVDPTPETLEHYAEQVRTYMDMVRAERGLIVAVTPGTAVAVSRTT